MRYLSYIIPVFLLLITACGGGSKNKQEAENSEANQTIKDTQSSDPVRTINIIGVNQMKFVVKDENQPGITTGETVGNDGMLLLKTITAQPGEKIHIRLTNNTKLPASAMSHNFILLKRSADPEAFDNAATQAKDNDYIPPEKTDQIIAHTDLAAGDETVEVTFAAPQKPGENEFICSFPGHFTSGMKGTLKVQ